MKNRHMTVAVVQSAPILFDKQSAMDKTAPNVSCWARDKIYVE